MSLANLRTMYALADADDIAEGRLAYGRYNAVMRAFAEYYETPFDLTVAAFVALSPNNDYFSNLRSLASVLYWHTRAEPSQIVVSTYNHAKLRALDYLTGRTGFLHKSRGPKIRSFYLNILDPLDPMPVTVDGHIHAIWASQGWTMRQAIIKSKGQYNTIAEDVRALAAEVGTLANAVQATIWFTRKRELGIVYQPQLHLFADATDKWRTLVDPKDAPPYKLKEPG